ncbi:MAG: hypothetical protein MMC33_004449 [Icmadophila ericetorum]|nr:hypothetical protein [Icmadophila ericetorum]
MDSATSSSPTISWPTSPPTHRQGWAPDTDHEESHSRSNGHANQHTDDGPYITPTLDLSNLPHGSKSLAGISLRSQLLGFALGISTVSAAYLALHSSPLWRAPFFLATLSLFHFLEYWTTARYNPSHANIDAFLLTSNGSGYNIAHGMAFLECIISHTLLKNWRILPLWAQAARLAMGFTMVFVGQVCRSVAMAQAGPSFNHQVQMRRRADHVLVTKRIYAWLRHPSYFGFWWWGLGTQVVLGNGICLVGYAVVLWRFFRGRIEREEELLIKFFGEEYVKYKRRTWVGIPFIS